MLGSHKPKSRMRCTEKNSVFEIRLIIRKSSFQKLRQRWMNSIQYPKIKCCKRPKISKLTPSSETLSSTKISIPSLSTTVSAGGSVVECSLAMWATRVQFPASAFLFFLFFSENLFQLFFSKYHSHPYRVKTIVLHPHHLVKNIVVA